MSFGFVIVTHNSEAVLPACLQSIPTGHEVIVVDNASRDRSAEIAKSMGAQTLVNTKNIGLGAACNQGARHVSASHVFFLNPDAVLGGNAVSTLEEVIRLNPEVAAFGPGITVAGKRQKFCRISYPQSRGQPYQEDQPPAGTSEVDFLDGAALVCNLTCFFALGGFDERIFLYYDDDDLCYRMRAAGHTLLYVAPAKVFHQRNGSSGNALYLDYFRSYHATRSKVFICHKYELPLDIARERRRAISLLFRSLITLNIRKAAKSAGVLAAL